MRSLTSSEPEVELEDRIRVNLETPVAGIDVSKDKLIVL
jgi:hypothetical protein